MRRIDEIIIHCSATPEGRDVSANTIRKWHKAKGWSDIGYHYIIRLNGEVEQGRPVERAGAHCSGRNRNSIGVCYIGGVAKDGKTPKDTRTEAQKASLKELVGKLQTLYHISSSSIHGHYHYAAKACPCFDVEQFIEEEHL